MRAALKLVGPIVALIGLTLAAPTAAEAGSRPGTEALDEFKADKKRYNTVQNRFFLKQNRFEVAPIAGYVPNNPFAARYVGGLLVAYHFGENFAAEGAFAYSPDLGGNDLKDLTHTLVSIAHEGGADGVEFQQPVDKMVLGATFAARWAPIYGKINLLGERVLNFDMYLIGGLGMLSIAKYYAVYDDNAAEGGPPTALQKVSNKAVVPINLGLGMNFFVSSSVAIKLDARNYFYFDKKPQYDPDIPEEQSRLYNNLVASVGVSIFFPKMKPRQYDF